MYIKTALTACVMLASLNASAGCDVNGCSGKGNDVVVSTYVTSHSSGRIYLQAPASTRNNLDCDLVEGNYMTLSGNHPLFKESYSTILTALSTNKTLFVRIKNGSPICEVNYVRMYL